MELITSVIVSTLTIGFTSVSCFIYYYYKHLKKQENYIQNIFNILKTLHDIIFIILFYIYLCVTLNHF
jgi:hypothetical protein